MLTLERLGYIERDRDNHFFTVTLKLWALGDTALKTTPLSARALSPMKKLAQSIGLTVHLAMHEKEQAVYVQKVDGPDFVRFDTFVGKRISLHCTAVGKVLLASDTAENQRRYLRRTTLLRHTNKTIESPLHFKKELLMVSENGWAIDDQEEELGVRCLAVPVRDRNGKVNAALGVTGTLAQLSDQDFDKIIRALKKTAMMIEGVHDQASAPQA